MKFKYVNDGVDPKSAVTIDQLFGRKKEIILPYKTAAELANALKKMNLMDMQSLAVTLGIKPNGERSRLTRACIDQFDRLSKTYGYAKGPEQKKDEPPFDPSKF